MGTRLFGFIIFMLSCSVMSDQLDFNKVALEEKIKFEYLWKDLSQEIRLTFELDKATLSNEYRHFKALRPSLLQMYSLKKMKQAVSKLDPRDGKVNITPTSSGIEYTITSRNEEWQKKTAQHLKTVHRNSLTEYLQQEYYTEFKDFHSVNALNTLSFKPDHKRFVEEGTSATKPIVEAFKHKFPNAKAREMASHLLSWIQTIPYDEIEDRTTSNGSGFLPPIHLINHNKGDCDSKATLFAHLMKQLYPNLRMVLIYLPKHALLGINFSVLSKDELIEVDGLSFVLTEPVGPAIIPIATAASSSLRMIDAGMYTIEKLY